MDDHDPLLVATAQTLRALLFVLKDLQPPDTQNNLADMMARLDLAMGAEVASGSRCVVVATSHDRESVDNSSDSDRSLPIDDEQAG
jgi:hypothetical protein